MARTWSLLFCLALGCGQTVFIDPHAAERAELQINRAERLRVAKDPRSYFHLRLATRGSLEGVRFTLLGSMGGLELPLDAAESQPCGQAETCLSFSLGPGLPDDLSSVQLSKSSIGHVAEQRLALVDLDSHRVNGDPIAANQKVVVRVLDPIRAHYPDTEPVFLGGDADNPTIKNVLLFPRRFDSHVAPGACGTPPTPDDPAWMGPEAVMGQPGARVASFSAQPEGLACLSIRPSLPGGGSVVASATLSARAVLERFSHIYQPPTERSPLVYQVLFDLEMPTEVRCSAAESLVSSAIDEAAYQIASTTSSAAEVLALPPVEIAVTDGVRCRQSNNRSFSAAAVASEALGRLDEVFGPERRARVVFVYASNLDIGLPTTLNVSLTQLRDAFRGVIQNRGDYLLAIAPERARRDIQTDGGMDWTTTQEPSFRQDIKNQLAAIWPFSTQLHSDTTVVPLLPPGQGAHFFGYRICMARPQVMPLGANIPGGSAVSVPITGPSYQVLLTPQIMLERFKFQTFPVTVEWEGCVDFCDRAPPGASSLVPWPLGADCR